MAKSKKAKENPPEASPPQDAAQDATPIVSEAPAADNTPLEEQSKTNEELLADLMGDYSAPLEETPATDTTATPEQSAPIDDKSDPEKYYQSGKKKGQPRPRRGIKIETNNTDPDNINFSEVLNGALFISLVDMLLPLLIETVNNRLTKSKIKASDLEMTADQRKRLAPLADAVVKRFNIQAHPVILLILGMASVYGMNFISAKQESKKS